MVSNSKKFVNIVIISNIIFFTFKSNSSGSDCASTWAKNLHQSFLINSHLTLSQRRPISYRNQSIDLQSKSMDWFLHDIGFRRERIKPIQNSVSVMFTKSSLLCKILQNFQLKNLIILRFSCPNQGPARN